MTAHQTDSPAPAELADLLGEFNAGRYPDALLLAAAMTLQFPLYLPGWMVLGTTLMNMGQIAGALVPMQKGVELAPDDPDTHNNLAIVLRDLGRLAEAEAGCRRALQLAPDHVKGCYVLGIILRDMGRMDEAEPFLRRAVSLDPASAEYRFDLANMLATSARSEHLDEAKSLLLEVVKAEPAHLGAWSNLGRLLFDTGYTSAAHTAYSAAAAFHPEDAAAHANLGTVLLEMGNFTEAEAQLKLALELDPDLANAHRGLASLFGRQGRMDESAHHLDLGFGRQPVIIAPCCGRGTPVQLLVLGTALEGNIPWRFIVDREVFHATALALEYFDVRQPLPPHQLIINAIGDADLCQRGLAIAAQFIARAQAPVINHPQAVLRTGRIENALRLGKLPGVIAPRMCLFSRADVAAGTAPQMLAQLGLTFPLLVRAQGFHGGHHFERVETEDAFAAAAHALPGEQLLAIEFMDSRAHDGLFRKYRIMCIGGNFYPVHMAISTCWKVHYATSEMSGNAGFRKEEESFLDDCSAFLGDAALAALEQIKQTLALDYCGIDFGTDRNGNILLYEANATMRINPLTDDRLWDYRRHAIGAALAATTNMLVERALPTVS
jgi:tetratricopeptide (TPR) repeat protein